MAYFGKILKQFIKQRKLSIQDIVDKTNIPHNSIKNLLNNRSKKMEYIETIAKTYNVSVDYFTQADSILINISTYAFAISIVSEAMHKKNISEVPKRLIMNLADSAYGYLLFENKNINECRSFIAGMVEHALIVGHLVKD